MRVRMTLHDEIRKLSAKHSSSLSETETSLTKAMQDNPQTSPVPADVNHASITCLGIYQVLRGI